MNQIEALGPSDELEVRAMLEASFLPVADLSVAHPVLLGCRDARGLAGVVGVEVRGESGLLRSLAVRPDCRGTGLGGALVAAAEALAAARGVRRLFLLTDTAERFFSRRGYARHPREEAPPEIRATTEFASVCPVSATFMGKTISPSPRRVLILCTGNSARSQIAEALLTTRGASRFEVASAGSRPASRVNPWAVRVLAEAGIAWEGRAPTGLDRVAGERWDLVITVCDNAKQACPILPGSPVMAHWGMPDPAEIEGSDEGKLLAFRETLRVLGQRIDRLVALPFETMDPLAFASRVREIGAA